MTDLQTLRAYIYNNCSDNSIYGDYFRLLQVKVSRTQPELSPGKSTSALLCLTANVGGQKLNVSIKRADLQWKTAYDKACSHLLLVYEIYRSHEEVNARSMKYEVGQRLYDISKNISGRVVQIPANPMELSQSDRPGQIKPIYIMNLDSCMKLIDEDELDHLNLIVGPSHENAAGTRISKWYSCLRYNRVVRICQDSCTNAESRGHLSVINRMCRSGKAADVLQYSRRCSQWDINQRNPITSKTALREAVDNHSAEVMKLLVGLGADPNVCDGTDDSYILHAALRDKSPGAIRTTRLLLSFMETKADPDGQARSSDEIASSDGKRYWLETSRNRKSYRKNDMIEMGVPHLPRFIFALAGQAYAQWMLVREIANSLANQEADAYTRMVFILGGPPGHGKTMAAKELSHILGEDSSGNDFLKISCANVNSVFELFGGSGAYQGSNTGSELNNFVVNHSDRIGIVNLDEFDRLNPAVRDGLFTIFDKGEWIDKKMCSAYQTKTLDCKKIIWILTTNAFDDEIISFYEKERQSFQQRKWLDINKKVKRAFRGSIETKFGQAMARRLGPLIPFVPFDLKDRIALVEDRVDMHRIMYSKPSSRKKKDEGHDVATRLVGNFQFIVDQEVVAHIADHRQYDSHKGATSVNDFLNEEIVKTIHNHHLEGDDLENTKGRFNLCGRKGEEEIDFIWPDK